MRKKMKEFQQRKMWVIGVAVFIGLGIGILVIPSIRDKYYKPRIVVEPAIAPEATKAPTTEQLLDQNNWVEYKDQEFGLTFKYPKGLVQNIYNEPNQEIAYYNGVNFGRMKAPEGTVYDDTFKQMGYEIDVKIDRTITLKEAVIEMDNYKNRPEFQKDTIKVASLPAYKYEGIGLDWYRTTVLFERNKKLYTFTLVRFIEEGEVSDEGKQVFDSMIKSITF
jgi:hypothetical protein